MSLRTRCRHLISIEQNLGQADGKGGAPENWQPLYQNVRALVRPLSADQRQRGGGLDQVGTHRVIVPDTTLDITFAQRIQFQGRTLEIKGVRNVQEAGRYLEISAEEIDA